MLGHSTSTHLITLSILFFLCFSTPLMAEGPLALDDLVVTAGLQPVSARDVASSITVITREEIEQRQVRYLSDLLRDVPGFAVSQAGGVGAQTQIRVRGAEANQLLVLIDGVPANDPASSDEFQYQFALTANIERIEIIRGPQSTTWGGDAIAGVINIIYKKKVLQHHLAATAEAGSFNTINTSMDGAYAGDGFQISGGASYYDSDGTNVSRQGSEKDGARNTSANISLDIDTGDAFHVRASAEYVDADSDFDDIDFFVSGLPVDANRVTKSQRSLFRAQAFYAPESKPLNANLSISRKTSDNDNFGDGKWNSSTSADTLDIRLRGGVALGRNTAQNHRLNFSVEYKNIDFSQRGLASFFGDPNQDQSYNVSGYALEYVGKPVENFFWTASARFDGYSDFDNASTWQIAASRQLTPGLRLRGSVGTAYKPPTFTERFGFFEDFFIGNPKLKPESSLGWELGVDTRWSDDAYSLNLTWFNQDLQNEIDGFVFDPESFLFTAKNKSSDSKREGIEAVFNLQMNEYFTLGATYTYTHATEKNAAGNSVREVRRPRNMAGISANYTFANARGNLNLNVNYTGSQLDVFFSPVTFTSSLVGIPSYTVVDIAASWKLTPSLEITGRVSNLLDENYEEILGFVRPGRAVYAGLRGRFDL